jgi:outer membrane protein assembly factor BamE
MRPFRIASLLKPAALLAAALLSACVYKLDTQQGNLLDAEQVDAVEVGMTRSQVRFLLGTPMVADPFSLDRWDYMYYFRAGKGGATRRSHVIVFFDGDTVSRIDRPAALQKGATAPTGEEKAVDDAKEQAEKQAKDPEA